MVDETSQEEPDAWAQGYAAFGCGDPKEPPPAMSVAEKFEWWFGFRTAQQIITGKSRR